MIHSVSVTLFTDARNEVEARLLEVLSYLSSTDPIPRLPFLVLCEFAGFGGHYSTCIGQVCLFLVQGGVVLGVTVHAVEIRSEHVYAAVAADVYTRFDGDFLLITTVP